MISESFQSDFFCPVCNPAVDAFKPLSPAVKVSVLMLAYNHERFVSQALESAINQEVDFAYEIVVADDCSTDGTAEIILSYAGRYPALIRPVLREKNLGGQRNFFATYKACRGEYVAYLECDDYWTYPQKLQRQVDLLDANPDCSMCFHEAYDLLPDGNLKPHFPNYGLPVKERYQLEDIAFMNFIQTGSVVARNHILDADQNDLYEVLSGDWMNHVIHAQHGDLLFINEAWGVRRIHGGGVYSRLSQFEMIHTNIEMIKAIDKRLNYQYTHKAKARLTHLANGWMKQVVANGHPFLNPLCTTENVDRYLVRSAILQALTEFVSSCKGVLLDIGCGETPYKAWILATNTEISDYIGIDIENPLYQGNRKPDLFWDGKRIPLEDSSVDCAIATELFEHLPDLGSVLREVLRVLKPGGELFFTVPFLWPLHDAPQDEYRYTPFSLKRIFEQTGFVDSDIKAFGGWDASLAQMIGLWLKRRPMEDATRQRYTEHLFPFYLDLLRSEQESAPLTLETMSRQNVMITGLHGTAVKPVSTGSAVECPVCGESFAEFLPFGATPRSNALCPSCSSLERHRLLWLFLQTRTELFTANLKFLDIAPYGLLSEKIRKLPNVEYLSIDKYSKQAMRNMDITDLRLPDNYFDCILCYHVLEHIPDDLKAMGELFRVLRPGGWAIMQVPLKAGPTVEGAHITDPVERARLFGQEDHVRYYGDDYGQRLESRGFEVKVDSFAQRFSENELKRYGIFPHEDIYYCTKPSHGQESQLR